MGQDHTIRRKTSKKKLYKNAQSLPNKINELSAVAYVLKPDLILLSETWYNTTNDKAFLTISAQPVA
jgi:hypothetical protein